MRAVIDTNVLLSGVLWHGPPHALLELVRAGSLTSVTSPALIDELAEVASRPKFASIFLRAGVDRGVALDQLRSVAEIVDPPRLAAAISRDSDDDAVLALAAATRPDLIISGDADLLVLGSYAGIPIMTPAQALAAVAAEGRP